ncbi:hypothetical protein RJ640_017701, partial [Escallonia rubra]
MVMKIGFEDDEFVLSNLVRMYVMCGAMEYAHVLFNSNKVNVERKTQMGGTVLWNVMVDGFVRNGDFRLARELFDEMPQRSVVSWNSMISGYAQNGLFKEAIKLFRDMQMGDTRPNYVTLVTVLPAISRLGALELGKWVHLYAERNRFGIDEVLGSALIDMYSKCGSIDKMQQAGVGPSKVNYISVLTACSHAGLVQEGKSIFDHM